MNIGEFDKITEKLSIDTPIKFLIENDDERFTDLNLTEDLYLDIGNIKVEYYSTDGFKDPIIILNRT